MIGVTAQLQQAARSLCVPMSHVVRFGGRIAFAWLLVLFAVQGCATPSSPDELERDVQAVRRLAWEAQRHANRAAVFSEAAERHAATADEAAMRADAGATAPLRIAAQGPLEKADALRLLKSERRLELYRDGEFLVAFPVALGFDPEGAKRRQGDGRTPEGRYLIDGRHETRRYGPGLHIDYPRPEDRERAARAGVDPGGAIYIHGLPRDLGIIGRDHARIDWTNGCVAVTDEEMAELWARVDAGTPIEILP